MPQTVQQQAAQALEQLIQTNIQAGMSARIRRMRQRVETDAVLAAQVLRELGMQPVEAPVAPPPTAPTPAPPPDRTVEEELALPPQPVQPTPQPLPQPTLPVQPPLPGVSPPGPQAPMWTGRDFSGVSKAPMEEYPEWMQHEMVQSPWKYLSGGFPALMRAGDWAATRIDPTVMPRTQTVGDRGDELPAWEQAMRWKSEPTYDIHGAHEMGTAAPGAAISPWFNPAQQGQAPPPDWTGTDLEWMTGEQGPFSGAGFRRKLATGVQQLTDLPAILDVIGLKRPLVRAGQALARGGVNPQFAKQTALGNVRALKEAQLQGAALAPPGERLGTGRRQARTQAEQVQAEAARARNARMVEQATEEVQQGRDPTETLISIDKGAADDALHPLKDEVEQRVAAKQAVVEADAAAAGPQVVQPSDILDRLGKSKPRYGKDRLAWESEIDKALYILGSGRKGKITREELEAYVRGELGADANIAELAQAVKAAVKNAQAVDGARQVPQTAGVRAADTGAPTPQEQIGSIDARSNKLRAQALRQRIQALVEGRLEDTSEISRRERREAYDQALKELDELESMDEALNVSAPREAVATQKTVPPVEAAQPTVQPTRTASPSLLPASEVSEAVPPGVEQSPLEKYLQPRLQEYWDEIAETTSTEGLEGLLAKQRKLGNRGAIEAIENILTVRRGGQPPTTTPTPAKLEQPAAEVSAVQPPPVTKALPVRPVADEVQQYWDNIAASTSTENLERALAARRNTPYVDGVQAAPSAGDQAAIDALENILAARRGGRGAAAPAQQVTPPAAKQVDTLPPSAAVDDISAAPTGQPAGQPAKAATKAATKVTARVPDPEVQTPSTLSGDARPAGVQYEDAAARHRFVTLAGPGKREVLEELWDAAAKGERTADEIVTKLHQTADLPTTAQTPHPMADPEYRTRLADVTADETRLAGEQATLTERLATVENAALSTQAILRDAAAAGRILSPPYKAQLEAALAAANAEAAPLRAQLADVTSQLDAVQATRTAGGLTEAEAATRIEFDPSLQGPGQVPQLLDEGTRQVPIERGGRQSARQASGREVGETAGVTTTDPAAAGRSLPEGADETEEVFVDALGLMRGTAEFREASHRYAGLSAAVDDLLESLTPEAQEAIFNQHNVRARDLAKTSESIRTNQKVEESYWDQKLTGMRTFLESVYGKPLAGAEQKATDVQLERQFGADHANTVWRSVREFAQLLDPRDSTGAAKETGTIIQHTQAAMKVLDAQVKTYLTGLVDQNMLATEAIDQFVAPAVRGKLGKLGADPQRRLPPVYGSEEIKKISGLKQKELGIEGSEQVVKQLKLDKPNVTRVTASALGDEAGWEVSQQIAVTEVEKALQRAGFADMDAQQLVAAMRSESAAPGVKAVWDQYSSVSFNYFKAKEASVIAGRIAESVGGLVNPKIVEAFEQRAALLTGLHEGAFPNIVSLANAIARTQNVPISMTAVDRLTGVGKGFPKIKAPFMPDKGEMSRTALDLERQQMFRKAEEHKLDPAFQRERTRRAGYGEGRKGVGPEKGFVESIKPQYGATPQVVPGKQAGELLVGEQSLAERLSPEQWIYQHARYLKAVDEAMILVGGKTCTSPCKMSGVDVMVHLLSAGAGGVGGSIGATDFAESQGLGGLAKTGAAVTGFVGGTALGARAPGLLYKGLKRSGMPMPAQLDAFLMNSLLSSPRSWFKAFLGAHMGAVTGGMEKTVTGLLEMGGSYFRGKGGIKAFAEGRKHAKQGTKLLFDVVKEDINLVGDFGRGKGQKKSLIHRIYGMDLKTREGWDQAKELTGILKDTTLEEALMIDRTDGRLSDSLVGKLMRAPDWGYQRLMIDAGFDADTARRMTLTGNLRTGFGRGVMDLFRPKHATGQPFFPSLQRELFPRAPEPPKRGFLKGTGDVAQVLAKRGVSPVPRVGLQSAEMGLERTVGPLMRALGDQTAAGSELFQMTPAQAGARGLLSGGAGVAGAEAQENMDPRLMPYAVAAAGPYALPFMLGAGAKQAYMSGGNPFGGGVAAAVEETSPISTQAPLGDLNLLGVAKMFLPAFLKDVAGAYDPVGEGRVTAPGQLERMLDANTLDTSTPVGRSLASVYQHAPAALRSQALGLTAELANISPWASQLPAKPFASLNRFGQEAFDPGGFPTVHGEPGGWQALPPSAEGIASALPPEEQAALLHELTQGHTTREGSFGEGVAALLKNAAVQTLLPTNQAMKPADLLRLDPTLKGLSDFGDPTALGLGGGVPTRSTTGMRVDTAGGDPITGVTRAGEQRMIQQMAGEENRRVYEFVKGMQESGQWDRLSAAQRKHLIDLFKSGAMETQNVISPRASLDEPKYRRMLAQLWQQ